MKFFLLALFVAAAAAAPLDDDNQAVELIVNGVPEGEPLELGGIVGINLKEHVDGVLASSSDLLHPLTAAGIAEAVAAAQPPPPADNVETPVAPIVPEPSPIEPPSAIIVPDPSPIEPPSAIIVPDPSPSEPIEEVAAPVPPPAAQLPNEIFNDGVVQIQLNTPEVGVMSTLQSWFNMIVNYFNDGVQTSHQIV